MTENLKKLLEEAEKNGELKEKLKALTDKSTAVEKAVEIAKEYGISLTADDFEEPKEGEISDDEVTAAAGGDCAFIGFGDPHGESKTCVCVIVGAAKKCGCFAMGSN